jgi:regulator of protease activity HflC (stomatin/prohibitin superfamily)
MALLIFLLFIAIALAIIAAKSLVIVKDTERLVVFRPGKLLRVDGSGLALLIPYVDKAVKVNIESIPKWRRLSAKDLEERAVEVASQVNPER